MVRHRETQPEQGHDAAGERLGLAQGKVEDEAQGQHELDHPIRVERLTARAGAPGWGSAIQCHVVQPQREVCASA